MKKYFLSIIAIILMGTFAIAGDTGNPIGKQNSINSKNGLGDHPMIGAIDTVVFDMSQEVINGSLITFPVYDLSSETINALDFSFMYNQSNFTYDTVLNLTTYISSLANYNSGNQTVYFTSNSLQNYANDSDLILVRFKMLTASIICAADLNNIMVYLNGVQCSYKVIPCEVLGVSEINQKKSFSVYPNPATNKITVNFNSETAKQFLISLIDITGRTVMVNSGKVTTGMAAHTLDVSKLAKGVYLLKLEQGDSSQITRVVVQ